MRIIIKIGLRSVDYGIGDMMHVLDYMVTWWVYECVFIICVIRVVISFMVVWVSGCVMVIWMLSNVVSELCDEWL